MKEETRNMLLTISVWAARVVVGGAFIFSGFTKAVDPWGTIFKLEQYLASVDLTQPRSLLLALTVILCIAEFLLGVSLLTGIYRRGAPRITLLFLAFFIILTGWIVIASPVEDCGCFGDALKLSNGATFIKNIILFAVTWWLMLYNRRVSGLFGSMIQWIVAVVSAAYIVTVSIIGYLAQPLVDFRPFPEGKNLLSDAEDSNLHLIYAKDGEEKEFPVDDLPGADSGWEYVGRAERADNDTDRLDIEDAEGNDVSDEIIPEEGDLLILVIPEYERRDIASTMYINRIHDVASQAGIEMIGIIGGAGPSALNAWRDLSMAAYPLYIGDDSQLKSLARGEMSLVYVKDGVISQKISLSIISNAMIQELEKGEISVEEILTFGEARTLSWLNRSYLIILLLLFVASFPQKFLHYLRRDRKKISEG